MHASGCSLSPKYYVQGEIQFSNLKQGIKCDSPRSDSLPAKKYVQGEIEFSNLKGRKCDSSRSLVLNWNLVFMLEVYSWADLFNTCFKSSIASIDNFLVGLDFCIGETTGTCIGQGKRYLH